MKRNFPYLRKQNNDVVDTLCANVEFLIANDILFNHKNINKFKEYLHKWNNEVMKIDFSNA